MSLAQQKQIDLLKKRVSKLEAENKEINRKLDLFLYEFTDRMAVAIDKVIGDGLEVEQTVESQLKDLMND